MTEFIGDGTLLARIHSVNQYLSSIYYVSESTPSTWNTQEKSDEPFSQEASALVEKTGLLINYFINSTNI